MDDSPRAPRVSPHHGVSGGMPLFESPSRSSTGALSLPPKKRHQGADAHVAVDTASGPADSAPLLSSASPSMYGQSKAHDRRRKDAPLYIPTPAQGTRQATRERERERQTATTRGAPRGGRGTSNYR